MATSTVPLPDGELLQRFAEQRDEAAFAAVVERHHRLVAGVCARITGDRHDAEEATQAVFLVLAAKAGRFAASACVAGWLHRVARHVALRARSSAAARRRRVGALAVEPVAREVATDGIDDLLADLPETYRTPLLLHYVDGLDSADIAARLGITPAAAAMRLSRGRERVRRRLGGAAPLLVAGALAGAAPAIGAAEAAAGAASRLADGLGAVVSPAARLAQQALASLAVAKAAVVAAWLGVALLVGATATGGWTALAADAPPVDAVPPARADVADADDAERAALTAQRIQAVIAGLASVGSDAGAAATLQRAGGLGGAYAFIADAGYLLPVPDPAAGAGNRFLSAEQIARPHWFARPWDRPDGVAGEDPDTDVSLDRLDVAHSFLDERGAHRLTVVALLALAGALPSDDAATDGDESAWAYCTDRDPARPWNDAWGNPLVVAWGLFQPTGAFNADPLTWDDPIENVAGARCAEALRAYGYLRSVYLCVASAGPVPYEMRAGHAPAPIERAAWAHPSPAEWTQRILPQVWSQASRVCEAHAWRGASFASPPWQGVRRGETVLGAHRLRCQLSAPIELR